MAGWMLREQIDKGFDSVEDVVLSYGRYGPRIKELLNTPLERNVKIWKRAQAPIELTYNQLAGADPSAASEEYTIVFARLIAASLGQAMAETFLLPMVAAASKEAATKQRIASKLSRGEINKEATLGLNGQKNN